MAFHNIPPNGFPDIPDMEELEAVEKDVATLKSGLTNSVKRFSIGEITGQTLSDFVLGVINSISNDIGVGECAEVYAIYPNVNYFMFNVLRFEGNKYIFTANNTTAMYYGNVNASTDAVALYLITATQQ